MKVAVRGALELDRQALVDVAFGVVLAALAVLGFDSSFGGAEAFTVGLPAVVAGACVGLVLARVRPPLPLGVAAGVLAFFLLGGALALRADATFGVLPTPSVWAGLVDGAVNGWVRLLTTVPPAGEAGNLLAIPYFAGFLGGCLAVVLALLVPRWPLCLVPPTAVLIVSVLFGVDKPASLLLQGAAFGAVTVGWLALRTGRAGRPASSRASRRKVVTATALLGVAAAGASMVGPRLPMAEANDRFFLRERVTPPFDPSQYPSPLTRFRKFDAGESSDEIQGTLFTVEGLPKGQVVRVAVMDTYDGYVWRASSPGDPVPENTYRHVGDEIPDAASGPKGTVKFTMGAFSSPDSVWVPTAGSPTSIRFTGERREQLTEAVRFNRVTEAAASPIALKAGDEWEVEANFPEQIADPSKLNKLATNDDFNKEPTEPYSDEVMQLVTTWTKGARSSYEQAARIGQQLNAIGAYNPGLKDFPIASGHSLARLDPFVRADQPQGNGEQFAAAVAYLAGSIGIPARVVLQFKVDGDGLVKVRSDDVVATVEIALQDVGWVALPDPTPYDKEPKTLAKQKTETPINEVQPPPPTTIPPPNSIPEEPDQEEDSVGDPGSDGDGFDILVVLRTLGIASIPVAVIAGPGLLVAALKTRRRKRRRTTGAPAERIAGGWNEVVDLAKDMGTPVPPKATRREISRFAAVDAVGPLAEQIDAAVFGHEDPDDAAAEELWQQVDDVRAEMLADRSRVERLRATVSLTSLRSGR